NGKRLHEALRRPAVRRDDGQGWRDRQLAKIAAGEMTTRFGVKACGCGRTWKCPHCRKPFVCWKAYPFLWAALPARLHGTKLCRACYGTELMKVLTERLRASKPLMG